MTKTERKESKNTQNILFDLSYLLFDEYLQERTCAYTLKLPTNTEKKSPHEEVNFLRTVTRSRRMLSTLTFSFCG